MSKRNPFQGFAKEWKSKKPRQKAFMIGGLVSLILALIGLVLPIVPQVPFAILAAFLFSKGSPKLHDWIRNNKKLGPPIKDWEDHRVVRPKLKAVSTTAMLIGAGLGHWRFELKWALGLDALFLACIVFVLIRKSKAARRSQ